MGTSADSENVSPQGPKTVEVPVTELMITVRVLLIIIREIFRFLVTLPFVGIFGDFVFSPMHRLSHHPWMYAKPLIGGVKWNHKKHHEFTTKLTSLAVYHGEFLDDAMMASSTAVGAFLYAVLAYHLGNAIVTLSEYYSALGAYLWPSEVPLPAMENPHWEFEVFSSMSLYLGLMNILFSHAHDIRMARLITFFVPDELNLAAYHYVHHLDPSSNFGLTEFSDFFWDRLLGVRTVRKLEDFLGEPKNKNEPKELARTKSYEERRKALAAKKALKTVPHHAGVNERANSPNAKKTE